MDWILSSCTACDHEATPLPLLPLKTFLHAATQAG